MKIIRVERLDDSRWAVTVDGIVRRVLYDEEKARRVKEALIAEEYGAPDEGITLPEALDRNAAVR